MSVATRVRKHWKLVLLITVAVSLTVLVSGYHHLGTAQSQAPQIGLNTPVTFPGDI